MPVLPSESLSISGYSRDLGTSIGKPWRKRNLLVGGFHIWKIPSTDRVKDAQLESCLAIPIPYGLLAFP